MTIRLKRVVLAQKPPCAHARGSIEHLLKEGVPPYANPRKNLRNRRMRSTRRACQKNDWPRSPALEHGSASPPVGSPGNGPARTCKGRGAEECLDMVGMQFEM